MINNNNQSVKVERKEDWEFYLEISEGIVELNEPQQVQLENLIKREIVDPEKELRPSKK